MHRPVSTTGSPAPGGAIAHDGAAPRATGAARSSTAAAGSFRFLRVYQPLDSDMIGDGRP